METQLSEDPEIRSSPLNDVLDNQTNISSSCRRMAAFNHVQKSAPEVPAGILRMEAAAAQLTRNKRVVFFTSIFVVAYVYGLDSLTRHAYVPYATSSYQSHSLLATINVIRGVVVAAIQPTIARLSDTFGRIEVFTIAVLLYTVGTVIETFAPNVQAFAGGAVLYQLGYSISTLTIEIMIADFTSVKTRLFFAFVPNWPFLLNTWISGNVTSAVLSNTSWKWGIGMFAILYPVCAMPLIMLMFILGRQARGAASAKVNRRSVLQTLATLFWELDIVGVLILTAALAMTLIPLTLAGGVSSRWRDAGILSPVVIGFVLFPVFVLWERQTSHPLVPFTLLKDRTVWASLGISGLFPLAFVIHANYLFTLLIVSYDFSITTATRIASLYSFCAVVVGAVLGVIVIKVRRLKQFIIAGTAMWLVGGGLIYHYRGGSDSQAGIITGEVIIGSAAGFFSWPVYVLIQTVARHEHISVLISLVFTANHLGQAFGNCISGAIWTQTLLNELGKNLDQFGNATLATAMYASPFTVVSEYPPGTPEREAIVASYRYIQRLLTIAAMCFAAPMLILAFFLRDPKLSSQQTQPEAEGNASQQEQPIRRDEVWPRRWLGTIIN